MKATHLLISLAIVSPRLSTSVWGDESLVCEGDSLIEVEGGIWICGSDSISYGTMCVLDCTDPYSIPEGDYQITCTPEGWFPDPSQVAIIIVIA